MIVNRVEEISKDDFLQLKLEYIDLLTEYHIHYLDGSIIKEEQDYLSYFKDIYHFPEYYGNNYNAFIDCMRDLDFRKEQGFILVIYNFSKLLKKQSKEKEIFIKALKSIAYYLEKECLTTSGGRNHLKSFDVYLIDDNIYT